MKLQPEITSFLKTSFAMTSVAKIEETNPYDHALYAIFYSESCRYFNLFNL